MKKIILNAAIFVLLVFSSFLLATQFIPFQGAAAWRTTSADQILTVKHYIPHKTTVPGFEGQVFQLYVHERVQQVIADNSNWHGDGKVVLFVHGYAASSIPNFDLAYKDYSWMAYLAEQGFDAFSVDLTGYGASTRPAPMDNPCNVDKKTQARLKVGPCQPTYPYTMTTLQSDWDDIDAAIDYLRKLRGVAQVSVIGSSWGALRVLGYASIHPEKIDKLIVQGTAGMVSLPNPPQTRVKGLPIAINTRESISFLWDVMKRCQDQAEPEVFNLLWRSMLDSDPLGATWGPGVVRSPTFSLAGANKQNINLLKAPTLLIGGEFDYLALPWNMQGFYRSLKTENKVHMTLNCASHFIIFERRHNFMYQASVNWLLHGAIAGRTQGAVTVKADGTYNWQ